MIPVAFDYERVSSVEQALGLLEQHGDEAKLMAGGHSLLPMMKLRLAYPSVIVDIGRLNDLSYINDAGEYLAIGALTRHRDIEISELVARHAPLLAEVTSHVGDPQVRHRGTIGGSLAHADAAADHPAALLALGGSVVVSSTGGQQRVIEGVDLFTGFFESAIEATEMITEVRIPKHDGLGWNFQKFNRRSQDWAIVGVAAQLTSAAPRIALINMHPTPIRALGVEQALSDGGSIDEAAAAAVVGVEPSSDLNASVEYRNHLAKVLTRRSLQQAGMS